MNGAKNHGKIGFQSCGAEDFEQNCGDRPPESAKFDEFRKTLSNLTENGAKNHRKREKLLSFWERKFSQSTVDSRQLKRDI